MASYSASLIAKWFLATNKIKMVEEDAEYISNLKLQKLLYYAQGTHLGIKKTPLFEDAIVAWPHGPVVESVYHEYKSNGAGGVSFDEDFDIQCIDSETAGILREVFDVFGQYSAWKLRDMTHDEDPWKNTLQNNVISVDLIRDYFIKEYIE